MKDHLQFTRCVLIAYWLHAEMVSAAGPASFCSESGWAQVWSDEFSATALDNVSWSLDLNGGDSRVRDSMGTSDNVYIEDGELVIRTQRQTVGKYEYTSGAVSSQGKRSWKGLTRACVRAKLPGGGGGGKGAGIWPAHWMMPESKACWPSKGEIDIMEMINGDGAHHATYHWREREIGGCGDKCANGSTTPSCRHPSIGSTTGDTSFADEFHEYAVEYSPGHIHFALDGVVFQRLNKSSQSTHLKQNAEFFAVPYYMILNTAVGGPWPGPATVNTTFPTYHRIDYVRIAQPAKETYV